MKYWLIKSEPEAFSIDDLQRVKREPWDGVRNYQARNFMRDEMKLGELALFYHSNAKPPGAAGVARVASEPYADPTQFDPRALHYDPKSDPENPRWVLVDFEFVLKFPEMVSLERLKTDVALSGMPVTRRGMRLSVMPVEPRHFRRVCELAGVKPPK